jgi:DNA-binding response OmpR family regulator
MARILIVDPEEQTRKAVFEAFKALENRQVYVADETGRIPDGIDGLNSDQVHELHFRNSIKGLTDLLADKAFDMAIIDSRLLGDSFESWVDKMREECAINQYLLVGLFTYEANLTKLKTYLDAGACDCFFKPIDKLIFVQKILLLLARGDYFEKMLFSFQTSAEIGVAHVFEMEDISEYGANIVSSNPFERDEYVTLIASAFAEAGGRAEILARCYGSEKHPSKEGLFLSNFVFIGIDPSTLTNIRKWIRQEYALQKQKRAG